MLRMLPILLLLTACTGTPSTVQPVTPFELEPYLGQWHEIARLDHRFERGLSEVTAHYSMRDDGGVRVLNRGYHAGKDRWRESEGRAYFQGDNNTGQLKVSFFGPFFASYNIAKLEPDYSMALVVGHNLNYAWILARTPTPSADNCLRYQQKAAAIGVETEDLIWLSDCLPTASH
ncbi:lipocalin family protein [Alkalimonas delamerensis]|uniref:Outer membrane lipoprotein Blc n=1 Tax=Alkalimonas delamerensis TaxID=265981 RepID=A0ABT9GL25_9GAMM|nr:lipocalin family protein [Alkalimonas delamerensis]MDP4527676.1 lipocalin family protein [Alkalimonas delamerensis]